MSTVDGGPDIINNGLLFYLDAANSRSYPGSGTAWNDLSRRRNNGTLVNGPTFNSANGGSVVFDGINDHVSFASNPSLTNQITVEVWVKLTSTSPNQFASILGREFGYRLIYSQFGFQWVCSTVNNGWYSNGTSIDAGSVSPWVQTYHVVGTYNGSNNRIYVNGTLRTTGSAISGNIANPGNDYFLMRSAAGNINWGKGILYSHRCYNRALSATEVLQNFNATRARFGI